MNVSEVRVGVLDAAGTPIEVVYVKNAPSYAIYRTHQRVMVHLADDVTERGSQQEMLATLNPLRNEINALIDGWRTSPVHEKEALTRLYDRRVADALALAFEGNPTSAQTLLKSTLEEISEERQSRGRIQHLIFAGGAVAAVAVCVLLATLIGGAKTTNFLDNDVNALMFAAAVGAVGALVSIAIAIQERRLATDLQPRDNISDAVLRIVVGSVGAVLLIAMLRADLINLDMRITQDPGQAATVRAPAGRDTAGAATASSRADTDLAATPNVPATQTTPGGATPPTPGTGTPAAAGGTATGAPAGTGAAEPGPAPSAKVQPSRGAPAEDLPGQRIGKSRTSELLVMLVIAFFAGFTERMVSRLAERIHFREVAADLAPGAPPQDRRPNGRNRGGAGEGNGGPENTGPAGAGSAASGQGMADEEQVDGCIAEVELENDDLTDDSELPEATGGVAEQPRT